MIDPLEEACLISAYGCIRLQPSFSGTRNKKVMWVPLFFMVALTKVYCLKFSARYIVIIDHFKKKIHSNSVSKLFFFICVFLTVFPNISGFTVEKWSFSHKNMRTDIHVQPSKRRGAMQVHMALFSWYFGRLWFGSLRRNHLWLTICLFVVFFLSSRFQWTSPDCTWIQKLFVSTAYNGSI